MASVACLIVMMIISFVISQYEYKINKVINTNEFETAFENVNRTHIDDQLMRDGKLPEVNSPKMIKDSKFNLANLEHESIGEALRDATEAIRNTKVDAWKNSILATS